MHPLYLLEFSPSGLGTESHGTTTDYTDDEGESDEDDDADDADEHYEEDDEGETDHEETAASENGTTRSNA